MFCAEDGECLPHPVPSLPFPGFFFRFLSFFLPRQTINHLFEPLFPFLVMASYHCKWKPLPWGAVVKVVMVGGDVAGFRGDVSGSPNH